MSLPTVHFAAEPELNPDEFRQVLELSGLGATRPVDDPVRIAAMLSGANLIMTARLQQQHGMLVGVARCVTDFSWCCYVSELAVARSAQGLGIGKSLLQRVRHHLGPRVSIILASMPDAVGFYERIGMPRLPDAFWYKRDV
jgi:ribosomal protein S18 acetylase RimI-like enzyme